MPELPEVETIKRGIASSLEGKTIKSVLVRKKQLLLVDDTWMMSLSEGINLENTGSTININNPQFLILVN